VTIEASRSRRFKGRDEREYLRELFAENTVFVTSDIKFAEQVAESPIRHAGIVYLPSKMTDREKVTFAEVAAGFIRGGCYSSPRAFQNCILYPAHDGVRLLRAKNASELAISWHELWPDG
jgi:hypothetical protein